MFRLNAFIKVTVKRIKQPMWPTLSICGKGGGVPLPLMKKE